MSETLKFLCRQFFLTPTKVNPQKSNLCGQTGIVTGSNIGLGLEASRQLLELGLSRYFDMQDRYYTSKLLQEIALIELCCTVPSSKGIVNVVNSGFCYGSALHTEVTTRFRVLGIIVTFAKRMIGRSTFVGARTLVDAPVVQGPASHGKYLSDCARYTFPPQLAGQKGEALVKRVWNETLKELAFANVKGILSILKEKEMTGKSKGDYLR